MQTYIAHLPRVLDDEADGADFSHGRTEASNVVQYMVRVKDDIPDRTGPVRIDDDGLEWLDDTGWEVTWWAPMDTWIPEDQDSGRPQYPTPYL